MLHIVAYRKSIVRGEFKRRRVELPQNTVPHSVDTNTVSVSLMAPSLRFICNEYTPESLYKIINVFIIVM